MKKTSKTNRAKTKPNKKSKAKEALNKPQQLGWNSTDQDEIERRRLRGQIEITTIEALERNQPFFGSYRVPSGNGGDYTVEIRDLTGCTNSCDCIDFQVNRLGTCKHIEGVLAALRHRKPALFRRAAKSGSQRVEVFLARNCDEATPTIWWPEKPNEGIETVCAWLSDWLGSGGGPLTTDPEKIATLIAAYPDMPPLVRKTLRISRHFGPWLERAERIKARAKSRSKFENDLKAGRVDLNMLKATLLPYQQEGMIHLAFNERALLADEMGLGKTIQAIAACELLKKRKTIQRVLVVCPASVKAEWEEQIARFTDRSTRFVAGPRAQRLFAYGNEPTFFTIVNYEQVVNDIDDINRLLKPDVVILDEAQRIKNWHTKTARKIKMLQAPHAFVLTGTPVENRIDEVYSIVQFLDSEIFGPLFRFNRDFYDLDEKGRPSGFKNMKELNKRLKPVMLRRRKADVQAELTERTIKNYFVSMAPEQQARYDDYQYKASILIAKSQRRSLSPKEFELLQLFLACMRMLCDTPAILDPACRISPKIEELEGVLGDLLEEPDRKIIIFSEWERMLNLVRDLANEMGIDCAWHTGSVPQQRRRVEINRFKTDPKCRLFLSTDAGATGLNLQAASAVINIDLPWNPAKLEQRIARAWRKNQTRKVTVVNLVTENSIEHNILHLLAQKQAMADGVLDGQGDLDKMEMPSGRKAMIDRMQALMNASAVAPRIISAEEDLTETLKERHGEHLFLLEARAVEGGMDQLLAVLDLDAIGLAEERSRLAAHHDTTTLRLEVLSRETWETMQRLAASGIMTFAATKSRILHRAETFAPPEVLPEPDALKAAA